MNHVTGDVEMETLYWILDGMDGSQTGVILDVIQKNLFLTKQALW